MLRYRLRVRGKGYGHRTSTAHSAADTVTVTVRAAPLVTGVAIASTPQADATYRAGEAIEVAATFSEPVVVTGAPTLGLAIGTDTVNRIAAYDRGSGTRTLVFAYTVLGTDVDDDGIAVPANGIGAPGNGIFGEASGVAILDHDALAANPAHQVDGSTAVLTGGVCDRTPQVRDALVAAVRASNSAVTDCSLVTPAHLGALAGTLDVGNEGIAALRAGDFADLGLLTGLRLNDNALTDLPAGLFDALVALQRLYLHYNDLGPGGVPDGTFGC